MFMKTNLRMSMQKAQHANFNARCRSSAYKSTFTISNIARPAASSYALFAKVRTDP